MSAKRPKKEGTSAADPECDAHLCVCVCAFACVWVCKPHGLSTATTIGQARRTHKGQHRGHV